MLGKDLGSRVKDLNTGLKRAMLLRFHQILLNVLPTLVCWACSTGSHPTPDYKGILRKCPCQVSFSAVHVAGLHVHKVLLKDLVVYRFLSGSACPFIHVVEATLAGGYQCSTDV